ncbi:MAG TPA: S16 family serine protease [Candidatus Marinimicrobia bacterium]|nr:S16 family serine protease [Candidatus Neomarinimicrobiota bacterium]
MILPDLNRKDLEDVPQHVSKDLTFHFVKEIRDVLKVAIPGVLNGSKKSAGTNRK